MCFENIRSLYKYLQYKKIKNINRKKDKDVNQLRRSVQWDNFGMMVARKD